MAGSARPGTSAGSVPRRRARRRDYEARLDEAYGQWKRPVFTSLFEPLIVDRRAAEAARKLRHG